MAKYKTPSALARHLESKREALDDLINGLKGKPFQWGETEAYHKRRHLAAMGVELVTRTQIKKRKAELSQRAKPVGSAYFGAPIQTYADLFVWNIHTFGGNVGD